MTQARARLIIIAWNLGDDRVAYPSNVLVFGGAWGPGIGAVGYIEYKSVLLTMYLKCLYLGN